MQTDDPWTAVKFLSGLLPPTETILDLGAHHGGVAAYLAEQFSDATIHCFEPNEEALGVLRPKFPASGRVNVHGMAISDTIGSVQFHLGVMDFTSSLLPRETRGKRYYRQEYAMKRVVLVPSTTIDRFCAEAGIARIGLMKMDLQGGETLAIAGAKEMLAKGAIDIIVSEAFGADHYAGAPLLVDTWAALRAHGYSLYNIYSKVDGTDGQFRFCDAIFLSPAARAALASLPDEP